jgi:hypothetical protein
MHEIRCIPFIFSLHVKIILEQTHDRNAYKIYKLFSFINVRLNWGWSRTKFCRSNQNVQFAELEKKIALSPVTLLTYGHKKKKISRYSSLALGSIESNYKNIFQIHWHLFSLKTVQLCDITGRFYWTKFQTSKLSVRHMLRHVNVWIRNIFFSWEYKKFYSIDQ